jgi:hypothetical protein
MFDMDDMSGAQEDALDMGLNGKPWSHVAEWLEETFGIFKDEHEEYFEAWHYGYSNSIRHGRKNNER